MSTQQLKKVLILRYGAIGDVVLTSALFRSLKKYNPDIEIHYITFKTPASLLENDPDLKKVWVIAGKTYSHIFKLAKELKKENFDVFINLHPSIKTRIFGLILGAKKTLTYRKTFKLHAVENFLKTARSVFKDIVLPEEIKIYLPEQAQETAKSLMPVDNNTVCFNIGANDARQGRRWPIEHWCELAEKLIKQYNCRIVLTGSAEDVKAADKITAGFPEIISFCGKLSLTESAAVIERCEVVVSGDTGPMHIAAALETRVIGLFGAMLISRTRPYGKNHFALQSQMKCIPCNRRKCRYLKKDEIFTPCMKKLLPKDVLSVIENNSLL